MIGLGPDSFAALALAEIRRWPGELSDRPIRYGRVLVCAPVEVGKTPPTRWVERLRAEGLLRRAAIRAMPHVTERSLTDYLTGLPAQAMRHLLDLRHEGDRLDGGLTIGELSVLLGGSPDPSGALEEAMVDLYRAGYASPPAGLWATVARRA